MRTLLTTPLGWALLAGVFGLLLRVVPVTRRGKRRRGLPGAGVLLVMAWLIPLACATPFVAERVSGPLLRRCAESPSPAWSAGSAPEVIVVLGGGLEGPRVPGVLLGRETGRRLLEAVRASRRWTGARVVFSGGTREPHEISSASRMAEEALALGVDPERIVVEDHALTTRENALYVSRWLDREGLTRVALLTSAIHMPRAQASFAREGVDVLALPIGARAGHTPLRDAFGLDAGALEDSTAALHEHLGLAYYRWKGWTEDLAR